MVLHRKGERIALRGCGKRRAMPPQKHKERQSWPFHFFFVPLPIHKASVPGRAIPGRFFSTNYPIWTTIR